MRVCIRDERRTGEHDWYDAGFQLDDPGKVICTDTKKYDHSRILFVSTVTLQTVKNCGKPNDKKVFIAKKSSRRHSSFPFLIAKSLLFIF